MTALPDLKQHQFYFDLEFVKSGLTIFRYKGEAFDVKSAEFVLQQALAEIKTIKE